MKILSKVLKPGDTIGIIGGGQLGRMMAQSAKRMGFMVGILDPVENCPAAQVADWHICADYTSLEALNELAKNSDVVTFEFENIDAKALEDIKEITSIPQGCETVSMTQDRIKEKHFLKSTGVSIAPFSIVKTKKDLDAAIEKIGYPSVLKTTRFGYDGKGQLVLKSDADKKEAESLVSSSAVNDKAVKVAGQIADTLQLVGTLGIELFLTKDDKIYVNELAPRPHNSGHYSIEAMSLSQFDAHIQAVVGLPLSKPQLLSPVIMVNILGQHMENSLASREKKPDWSFHYYGKDESSTDRKMGHITILTDDLEKTLKEIEDTKIWNGGIS